MPTPFEVRLHDYRSIILQRLSELLPNPTPASLYDAMRYALSAPGKLVRPTLLLLCCEAVGGKRMHSMNAALALELIHNFTLVHDDIMDRDSLRRGRETVYKKWDENVAILAGDGLLVLAFSLLAELKPSAGNTICSRFCQAILEVCEGQALDKEFENRPTITLDEYFLMIQKKTGRLFELACEAGAVLGDGSEQAIAALKNYGAKLGRAFQVQDDLLDVMGAEETFGKDVGSDIKADKKTFLIAHAHQFADHKQSQQLQHLLKVRPLEADTITKIIDLFSQIGTIQSAQQEISACLQTAASGLAILPASEAKSFLLAMLEKLADRNH